MAAAQVQAVKLKDAAGTRNMITQVILDQFVHHPLMYFPAFYSLKEVINGGTVYSGIQKYQKNYQEDLLGIFHHDHRRFLSKAHKGQYHPLTKNYQKN